MNFGPLNLDGGKRRLNVLISRAKGRLSEAGPIPTRYRLAETSSASYLQRTGWNVRDSDGTAVFTLAAKVTGGSLRTIEFARKHRKPCVHISRLMDGGGLSDPAAELRRFVGEHGIRRLNVAGSRESKETYIPRVFTWHMILHGLESRAT